MRSVRRLALPLARTKHGARLVSNVSSEPTSRIVYVNGDYVPEAEANISVFDRGFLMGDAVYEVTAVVHGKLLDYNAHYARLQRSLAELGIASPCNGPELLDIHRTLIVRNGLDEGLIYLQATRGYKHCTHTCV